MTRRGFLGVLVASLAIRLRRVAGLVFCRGINGELIAFDATGGWARDDNGVWRRLRSAGGRWGRITHYRNLNGHVPTPVYNDGIDT